MKHQLAYGVVHEAPAVGLVVQMIFRFRFLPSFRREIVMIALSVTFKYFIIVILRVTGIIFRIIILRSFLFHMLRLKDKTEPDTQ